LPAVDDPIDDYEIATVHGELMTKQFLRLLLVGALSFPASLYAMGLGEIHLNSALSQPFDAEIELLSPTSDELSSLKVDMASAEMFSRSGLDRPQFLSGLRFKIVAMGQGHVIVRVSSLNAIAEPVVTFLVEANWAHGRVLREYTVLLDPPVFIPNQPEDGARNQPIAPPATVAAHNEGVIERTPDDTGTVPPPTAAAMPPPESVVTTPVVSPPTPKETQLPQSATSTPTPMASDADTYQVQRNDTLSKIASQLRPGTKREVNQTMVALYRANPRAFTGNINRLKAGAVLRVPSTEEVTEIDQREAGIEVSKQYGEWRNRAEAAPTDNEGAGHLRLVAPSEPAESSKKEKAAQELAAKKEAAEMAKREAAERKDAEAKAKADAEASRLLELKNAEMARLQNEREQKIAAEKAAAETKAKAIADADAKKAAADAKAAEDRANVASEAANATAPVPAETPPAEQQAAKPEEPVVAAKPKPMPAPAPVPEPPSLWSAYGNYILGGGGIVLLLALWLLSKRKKAEHLEMPAFSPSTDFGVPTMTPADFGDAFDQDDVPVARPESRSSRGLPESIPEAEGTKPLFSGIPPSELRSTSRNADDTMSSETAVHVDQPDALAEADFHMAYGLYDQAADLVKIALQREPNRRDLKLKLLEIFFVWGNKDQFVEAARDLHTTRDHAPSGEWDKIVIMGKQIAPDNSLFAGNTSGGDMLDVNLEGGENRVDFDLFSTPESNVNEPAATLDFEVGNTGERAKPAKLDFLLDESGSAPKYVDDDTREMDSNARTQETPTIEMPAIDPTGGDSQTMRERTLKLGSSQNPRGSELPVADRTAELSLDDLGLDVGSLEQTGSLGFEHTSLLPHDSAVGSLLDESIGDEEMTRIAPAQMRQQLEPTREMPKLKLGNSDSEVSINVDARSGTTVDDGQDEGVDTIYLEQIQADSGELVDTMGLGAKSGETAHMLGPTDMDLDLDKLGADMEKTSNRRDSARSDNSSASSRTEVLADLRDATGIEPVTMSEVGTKLDLARAYMDMGDPDGARSILEEVLQEGNSGQRSEAQRLLDSIR
jgi:pilus assembly protein FimV